LRARGRGLMYWIISQVVDHCERDNPMVDDFLRGMIRVDGTRIYDLLGEHKNEDALFSYHPRLKERNFEENYGYSTKVGGLFD
jgi:hypothetical protein